MFLHQRLAALRFEIPGSVEVKKRLISRPESQHFVYFYNLPYLLFGENMNRIIRFIVIASLIIGFAASPLTGAQAQSLGPGGLAPLSVGQGTVIPNQYIVVLKSTSAQDVQTSAINTLEASGGKLVFQYGAALNGFAAILPDNALLALRQNPQVDYIEADQVVSLGPDQGAEAGQLQAEAIQTSAPWGLDRIDQRALPLNNTYIYTNAGAGVHVYIIDTGIRSTHNQFGGRASKVFDSVGDGQNGNDCAGHGTHVAGTIGGSTYGVAKAVKLYAVRVLDCAGQGSYAGVIAGVNWVAAHRVKPAVANMSLGGPFSAALNSAVNAAVATGVTFVVAAGNDNLDACGYSPSSTPAAITVGATYYDDSRSYFSNWGSCVDIFAPGSFITSSWIGSNTATNTISGTSMASPHVAGVAARYLQLNPTASPAVVAAALISLSTKDVVIDPAGSVNLLLFSNITASIFAPTTVTPIGLSNDTTPTYSWTKVIGAAQYQFQLYKGPTLVYTKTVLARACAATPDCEITPTKVLPYATYAWKVRALVGGVWRIYSAPRLFTLTR